MIYGYELNNDVATALAAAKANPGGYDAALFDFTMPGKTGLELAKEFHSLNTNLPILIMTGHLDESSIERSLPPNVVGIVKKPFYPDTLVAAIKRAL